MYIHSIHIYFLRIFLPSNNCLVVHVDFTDEMFSCMDNVGIKLESGLHRESCFKSRHCLDTMEKSVVYLFGVRRLSLECGHTFCDNYVYMWLYMQKHAYCQCSYL